jgi:hypothetical protein
MHPAPLPWSIQLAILLTLLLLDLGGIIYFLNDLYQPARRVNAASKDAWALIIIIGSVIGWFLYTQYGRDGS